MNERAKKYPGLSIYMDLDNQGGPAPRVSSGKRGERVFRPPSLTGKMTLREPLMPTLNQLSDEGTDWGTESAPEVGER